MTTTRIILGWDSRWNRDGDRDQRFLNWNWYGFPGVFTAAYISIQIIGFLCIGLVAALVLRNQKSEG